MRINNRFSCFTEHLDPCFYYINLEDLEYTVIFI